MTSPPDPTRLGDAPEAAAAPARDIETEADIEAVVRAFYGGIEADDLLGPYFAGLDWGVHLPKMVRFWSSVVFQTGAYRGRPFDPHARMPGLDRAHFARWSERFRQTVEARFAGPRADLLTQRAAQIAGVFQVKLGLWSVPDDGPVPHSRRYGAPAAPDV